MKEFDIKKATDREILEKIDSGYVFEEREIEKLVYSGKVVDNQYGDNNRWTRWVYTIIQLEDRFFGIDWEEGLTESQEDLFYETSLEEVEEFEEVKVIKGWRLKK